MLLKQFTRTDGEPSPWRLLLSRMGDPVTLAWIGLALSLIHLYRRLGAAHPFVLGAWLSSDTLLPADVAIDLFKDGFPFSGWTFSIAPCWFPDVFLAGAFWAITRNAITATLLSGFVQPALLVGAFCHSESGEARQFPSNGFPSERRELARLISLFSRGPAR
jgi:hypothetical protein